ncbi:MAG: hypothetical protein JXB85_15955 [Anaerolineales bacterium]|nr:hypothetical protein [Anaerolineales bacterium]
MNVIQIDLANRRQVKDLLDLPFRIYRDDPLWVPPLAMDSRALLNPKKHPFYRYAQAAFFLAYGDRRQPLGRIVVMDNRRYNEYYHSKTAFFNWFECENDPAASQALFESAFEWARGRGLVRVIGPRGFTPLEGRGLLVEGFEYRPAFGVAYNPPYYPGLVEAAGFRPHHEYLSGYLRRATAVFPERVRELAERVAARRGLRVVNYHSRRELRGLFPHLKELYNASISGVRDNIPIDDADLAEMGKMLQSFADPELVKLVMKEDEVVGFIMAYPDVSAAIQKTRGRLFPLGWIVLLREFRRTDWVNLNGIGLKEEYRGLGGSAILAAEIAKTLLGKLQYRVGDFVQIDTTNDNMLREIANFGVVFCKKHRVYTRDL